MDPHATSAPPRGKADFGTLRRFLPYLWPKGEPALRARVVVAMLLVLLAKSTTLVMPFAFKGAIDRMAAGVPDGIGIAVALVCAYALARFGGVLFDNVRNAIFETVGQTASRRLRWASSCSMAASSAPLAGMRPYPFSVIVNVTSSIAGEASASIAA